MADTKPMSVDELNSLLGAGAKPTQEGQPAQPAGPVSQQELTQLTAPKAAPTVGFGEDVARSAGAGFGRGALGLIGLPGDVRNLVEMGLQKAGYSLGERYVPTSEEVVSKAKEVMPSLAQHLDYEPQYAPSKYAKTAAEFLPSAIIPGGGLGLGARAAGAVGAGLATQATENYLKDTPAEGTGWETAAKLAASVPGFMAGTKAVNVGRGMVGGVLRPGAEAERQIVQEMGKDVAAGGKYGVAMTPAEAAASGAEVAPAAIVGSRGQKLLQNAAERVSPEVAGAFETAVEPIRSGAPGRLAEYVDNLFGGQQVSALDEIAAIQSRARQVNSANYEKVMGLPHAQNIGGPELQTVVNKLPRDVIPNVAESLRESGMDPATFGLLKTRGGWEINPQGMPLRFWDEVKQTLDTKIRQLKDPVTGKISDTGAWNRWNTTNTELKKFLDNAVGEYGAVRGAAAEAAGAANAIELGMNYLKSNNPKQIALIERTIQSMPAEQRYDFAYGVAGHYKDLIDRDPKAALNLFSGSKGGDRVRRLNTALAPLGENVGYDLVGRANAEMLNANLQSLKPPSGIHMKPSLLPYATGAVGGAIQLGEMLLQPALWSGNPAAFATALVGFAGGKLYNWKEARIASKVLEYMADPKNMARLGELVERDAAARSFLAKTNKYLGRAVAPGLVSDEQRQDYMDQGPAQTVKPQADGGRVGRASGGRAMGIMTAERLMRAAHAAKLKINKSTEQILDEPDEAVVKALDVAKQHI